MLILSTTDIDVKIICPSRNKSKYKLNEWRNIFAQAIGFKSFHEMSKRESVLITFRQVLDVIDEDLYDKFYQILDNEITWHVPSRYNNYFCVAFEKEYNYFSDIIYEDDGSGLWNRSVEFFKIGSICITKAEFDKFTTELNMGIDDDTEVDQYYISDCLSSFQYEERGHPYDYWTHRGTYEERQELVNCRTMKQLYAAVCDYVGTDSEELFASYGFSLSEFIEEILEDEDCLINE
ncbi:hypothetical protein SAMN05660691_04033 [Rheinheimera pacifica]|uniref:Uncharacterized protein n=1 Tax=Rheinheimera pacifica TaxID=173990 RepID=A0A1H6NQA4_9GAMM|nr:hypothetical protein [Rheinheimera pacifica]SEI13066.1 hypothetical protein SAMN05660691_04033 [Rheinheimera pacifica]